MTNARLEELRTKFQENPRRYFAPYANELRKAGDLAQAISVCRAHLSGQPGHVSGHIVLGQALYEAGEATEAREIFTAALDLDPENLIALRTLGEISQVNGEFSTARQWYERLLDADPRNSEVAQLLKDLPETDAPREPSVAAAPTLEPIDEAKAEPLPYNATAEAAPAVPPPPAPSFHTSFTGSSPAIVPDAPKAVPEPEKEELDIAPAPHLEFSEPEPSPAPVAPASHEPVEAIDMIDLESFPTSTGNAVPEAAAPLPDESVAPSAGEEMYAFEPMSAESTPEAEEVSEPVASVEESPAPEASSEAEPPRARFAELGFEGRFDDQVGWMATPSASLSELESAPEDWFDEPPATPEPEPQAAAEEPAPAQMLEQDHRTDSWFDDVEGAAVIEATEVANDEFWLPPNLERVSTPEEAAPAQAEEFVDESSSYYELPPETPPAAPVIAEHEEQEPVEPEPAPMLSAHDDEEPVEHGPFNVDVAAESADEEVVVERPVEFAPHSYWSERDLSESGASASTPVAEESEPIAEDVSPEPVAEAPSFEAVAEAPSIEPVAEMASPEPVAEIASPEPVAEAARSESVEEEYSETIPIIEAAPRAIVGHTPVYSETVAPSSQPATPFVTETLAELYLQQGFRDEALSIYRQLAERNPDDATLKQRIASIEQGEVPAAPSPAEAPVAERAASQSVRTFFSRLARRPAVTPPAALKEEAKQNTEVPFANAASALANLFAASKPPATDEGAASTLAGAFTDPAGRPSRAADRELSLDHLFRDVPPGGQASGGVTLDEFYSTPNEQSGSPTEPGEASESAESGGTDIRQFTAWLEGLRKK